MAFTPQKNTFVAHRTLSSSRLEAINIANFHHHDSHTLPRPEDLSVICVDNIIGRKVILVFYVALMHEV